MAVGAAVLTQRPGDSPAVLGSVLTVAAPGSCRPTLSEQAGELGRAVDMAREHLKVAGQGGQCPGETAECEIAAGTRDAGSDDAQNPVRRCIGEEIGRAHV